MSPAQATAPDIVFCRAPWYSVGMKMYRFKADAKDQIDRAGVPQAAIARGADYDRHELNKRIARQALVRPATANRIARVFAEEARLDHDAALALLFEETEVER